MALLMAYKLKFVALIPTLVGGLILLKATALLAGFFFALFAAVLGLKVKWTNLFHDENIDEWSIKSEADNVIKMVFR